MELGERLKDDAKDIYTAAVASLFELFEELCEGAIAVDADSRIVWINDKYRVLLDLDSEQEIFGRPVEEVIPNSLMRRVIETGRPILLDIMEFGNRSFVVTRIPLKDPDDNVIGGVGFVVYDRLDYLKPLVTKVEQLRADVAKARLDLDQERRAKYTFSQFVGTTATALETKRHARRAAQLDTTVILLGETGTGKELLAQAIHAASPRATRSFVGINVAAVPENLLEAEFFGVSPGAYTGADRKGRHGKFKVADGGTLFLDEVGDMPRPVQGKLLRVLQEKELEPLGSNKVIHVDVRVIAATSLDLKTLVDNGKFRSDLYYRLNVLPIAIPPLRERLADIGSVAEVLLDRIAQATGDVPRELTPEAVAILSTYDWPGNVRELQNVLERACVLTDGPVLDSDDFARILPHVPLAAERQRPTRPRGNVRPLAEAVAETERSAIEAALEAAGGTKAEAARLLGISRAKLYDRLSKIADTYENNT